MKTRVQRDQELLEKSFQVAALARQRFPNLAERVLKYYLKLGRLEDRSFSAEEKPLFQEALEWVASMIGNDFNNLEFRIMMSNQLSGR